MRVLLLAFLALLAGCSEHDRRCAELRQIAATPEEPPKPRAPGDIFAAPFLTPQAEARMELKSMTIPCKP